MKKINEITKGKAKSMFTTENDDHLIMHFSDDTSAFDGKKKEALLGKGAVNNQFNAFIMDHLKENGVETHLIEVIDSTDSLVYKLDMFPIECVIRNRASGSICKRLGTEDGLVLENPLFEFFLKDDELGDPLINDEHILSFGWANQEQIKEIPEFSAGDDVVVQVRVKEGERERLQAFEGVVIAIKNRGINSSFTVRKISHGEGVERVFQTHSPLIASIKVKRRGKVRRSKLYYLRELSGKAARIKEKLSTKK